MLKIALAKGRLGEAAIKQFQAIGLADVVDLDSRKLIFRDAGMEYLLLKPSDVITYVQNGIADLGVVGSDVIQESGYEVYELMDMAFGKCKFSVAAPKGLEDVLMNTELKVATKYPNVTRDYFADKDLTIIPLMGSVELAPVAGLADCIVDIVETGKTLEANDLVVIEDICSVSARLICNKVSYRFNKAKVVDMVEALRSLS